MGECFPLTGRASGHEQFATDASLRGRRLQRVVRPHDGADSGEIATYTTYEMDVD